MWRANCHNCTVGKLISSKELAEKKEWKDFEDRVFTQGFFRRARRGRGKSELGYGCEGRDVNFYKKHFDGIKRRLQNHRCTFGDRSLR